MGMSSYGVPIVSQVGFIIFPVCVMQKTRCYERTQESRNGNLPFSLPSEIFPPTPKMSWIHVNESATIHVHTDIHILAHADMRVRNKDHVHIHGVRASAPTGAGAATARGQRTAAAPDLRHNSTLPLATMPSQTTEQDAYLEARASCAKLQNHEQTIIRTTPHSRIHAEAPERRTA